MLPFSSAPWTISTILKGNGPRGAMWPPRVTHGYLQRAGARVEMCLCSMRNQVGKRTTVSAAAGVSALQLCSSKAGSHRVLSQGYAHMQHTLTWPSRTVLSTDTFSPST